VHELIRDRDDDEDRTVPRTIRKPIELAVLKRLSVFVDTLRECGRERKARRDGGGRDAAELMAIHCES
jgi:hypothetical protein